VQFLSVFRMSSTFALCTNVKSPYWRLSGDGSDDIHKPMLSLEGLITSNNVHYNGKSPCRRDIYVWPSGITRGLNQAGKLSWRGPFGHRRGPTSQNSEKSEMIVNHWMSWMSVLAKKTFRKMQKNNNPKNIKYQNFN